VTDEKGRIRHEFTADAPNQLWIGDITEHWTAWIPAVVATAGLGGTE
jgi:transposase InsO family protein